MDAYSNSTRFLGKHNISTLAKVKEYKEKAINKIIELKGLRENLWRKHNRIKTDKEKQFICSEIGFLAKQIDELKKDITICENIENRVLKMRDNLKDMNQFKNIKNKVRNICR